MHDSGFVDLLRERIVILDGAMGTNLQLFRPQEADYRGERFADTRRYERELKNNNDLLNITRPDFVGDVHGRFLTIAGADIIETNTFNATSIAQSDFFSPEPESGIKNQGFYDDVLADDHLREIVREINLSATKVAHDAAEKIDRKIYIAGAIGPMPVTASLSPDVNDPGFRRVNFDQLRKSYREQIDALCEGGVDVLLVETIFDTLNAKAALFAIEESFEAMGSRIPVMISGTITDRSGRTLSGQTVEAFWTSIKHFNPISVGLNCALGATEMRPFAQELARVATCPVSIYANAGLPSPLSPTGFDQSPEDMSGYMQDYAKSGFLNIVGGCCGTTPEHVAAIHNTVKTSVHVFSRKSKHYVCPPSLRSRALNFTEGMNFS